MTVNETLHLMKSIEKSDKKTYVGIDFMKLVCAVLVVYMHTYCWDSGRFGLWLREEVVLVAVPFFFISSGYFYGVGIRRAQDKTLYLRKYLVRILKMYIIWTLLSLPVALNNISMSHSEYGVLFSALYLIRSFVFTGSIGVYWYLLSLIYNSIILYMVYKKKLEKVIFPFAMFWFGIGVLYAGGLMTDTIAGQIIHIVFGGERNFLNVGLFYMLIGYVVSDKKIKVKSKIAAFLCIMLMILQTIVDTAITLRFFHAFTAVALFVFSHQIKLSVIQPFSKSIRKLSTAIYLTHFPFILIFDFYLQKGTLLDFSVTMIFVIGLYFLICKLFPQKWVTAVYGN